MIPGVRENIKIYAVAFALLLSGFSGLINQVLWQRALKTVLGGGESLSMTIVVVVFMLGLGLGSYVSSKTSKSLRNPIVAFAGIELLLAISNAVVCWLFTIDLGHSVFVVYEWAQQWGVSLQVVYSLLAVLILLIPCFLMGVTVPLTAEVCQRNFRKSDPRLISRLIAVNTIGSVVGVVISCSLLIPYLGISKSMLLAVGANLVAVVLILFAWQLSKVQSVAKAVKGGEGEAKSILRGAWLAFFLGFASLSYEMYLFRFFSLTNTPLPQIFAATVAGFLIFWSIGAALSSFNIGVSPMLAIGVLILNIVVVLFISLIDVFPFVAGVKPFITYLPLAVLFGVVGGILVRKLNLSKKLKVAVWIVIVVFCTDFQAERLGGGLSDERLVTLLKYGLSKFTIFLPCLVFGYLFGKVISQKASSWGGSVGIVYVFNTVGSCLGVLAIYFIGSLFSHPLVLLGVLALVLVCVTLIGYKGGGEEVSRFEKFVTAAPAVVFVVTVCVVHGMPKGYFQLNGKEGVIRVYEDGNMFWDGLWHSALAKDGSQRGTKNWYLATVPALSHGGGEDPIDTCVIGVGTGITASTLASFDHVRQVDAYDINESLQVIFDKYPEGTLGYKDNEKIKTYWMDARAGMILNQKKYDIIQTQPMYLKQAGSSLLNSKEFFELVERRLKPGGVFCLYSNGTKEQAFVVRETADKVFRYRETFFNGYMVILSNSPIDFDEKTVAQRLRQRSALAAEFQECDKTDSLEEVLAMWDSHRLPSGAGELIVSDDNPIIEYKYVLEQKVNSLNFPFELPRPGGINRKLE